MRGISLQICGHAAIAAIRFVADKSLRQTHGFSITVLDLGSEPHTKLHDPLELFRFVVPPIVVAEPVRRKIVVRVMSASMGEGQHVIRTPRFFRIDLPAAKMAAMGGLPQNGGARGTREPKPSSSRYAARLHASPTSPMEAPEVPGKARCVRKRAVVGHGISDRG